MRITSVSCGVEREPLKTSFGFKGSALTCLWQVAVKLQSEHYCSVGLGVQSVLWSDAGVFQTFGEADSNDMMYQTTRYALSLLQGMEIGDPFEALDKLFSPVYSYAVKITNRPNLSKTFVLNALVPVDLALWQLWARDNHKNFDDIWNGTAQKQQVLANVPLITYGTSLIEVRNLVEQGTPLLKIKIGSDPNKNGSIRDMVNWDKKRLREIHETVCDLHTPYTENGHVLYYLDANGRYDSLETLRELLDYADKLGFLKQIILLEEPFREDLHLYVGDLPVCVAADESVHGMEELEERCRLGYGALTLKPIAKGVSTSVRMAAFAETHGMACFCADLTVNPAMVTWNQCAAARLPLLPGMKIGVVESNGGQNYVNWEAMKEYPAFFVNEKKGVYELNDGFFENDGGIFLDSEYYETLASKEETVFEG